MIKVKLKKCFYIADILNYFYEYEQDNFSTGPAGTPG